MIKAVVFDFFGVLCSDQYWRYVRQDRQADSVFKNYADEVNLGDISWQSFVEKIAKATNTTTSQVNTMYATEQIDPRVAHLIDTLHDSYKTGLLTNAHHEFIDGILAKNHLADLFDNITISSRVGVVKPNPAIFEIILESLDVNPSETVYIDDLERHVASANSLGIKGIVYQEFDQAKAELETYLNQV